MARCASPAAESGRTTGCRGWVAPWRSAAPSAAASCRAAIAKRPPRCWPIPKAGMVMPSSAALVRAAERFAGRIMPRRNGKMPRAKDKTAAALLDELLGEASWLLSHADALAVYGRHEEAAAELARAAVCEEQVAG